MPRDEESRGSILFQGHLHYVLFTCTVSIALVSKTDGNPIIKLFSDWHYCKRSNQNLDNVTNHPEVIIVNFLILY